MKEISVFEYKCKYNFINFLNRYGKVSINDNGKSKSFLKMYCGFDIETTKTKNGNTFPYHFQFNINDDYITCRTIAEHLELIDFLVAKTHVESKKKAKPKMLIFIHNMSYEFSFLRKYYKITKLFAKEKRKPVYFEIDNLIFLDSYLIENKSLANLAKDYNLPTQKAIGDLDYTKIRNSLTPLTFAEKRYNYNDVKILSEYAELVYFKQYLIKDGYMPLTNTQKVRHAMKSYIMEKGGKQANDKIKERISQLFPPSALEYRLMFRWLFRGGFVHANYKYSNVLLKNIHCVDFTSSYIYVLLCGYFPMSEFRECENLQEMKKHLEKDCCIIKATFTNIKQKTEHSIESFSKCINPKGYKLDNGRIMQADEITVYLTELDYKMYCNFYEWENMEIHEFKYARRGRLPEYVIIPMLEFYKNKNSLKGVKGMETQYMRSKNMLNSFYGCMVTRIVFDEILLDDEGNWDKKPSNKEYDKYCKALLSPYWGIWTTAHARYNELTLLHDLRGVIYSDTDSHKYLDMYHDYNISVIDEYNKNVYNQLINACKHYGIDKEIVTQEKENVPYYSQMNNSLGFATFDGNYIAFKTLGAKRYIYLDEKLERHTTIAGLPKNFYVKENSSIYRFFTNFTNNYVAKNCKLCSVYCDEYTSEYVTDDYGNCELMEIESHVTLEDIDFSLTIDTDYFDLIQDNGVRYMLETGRI